jgi:lipopolysaccharide/colanic/teichoic acid biosynthesis glycosyltransferase
MSLYTSFGKRTLDAILSAILLVLTLPIVLVTACAIRYKLGTPVLFVQERAGWHGRPFFLLKFRTMSDDRQPDGALRSDAERLTPFGRWLRATSLDELPTLWNVVRGEMSLVGPRPLHTRYLPRYTAEQARRHDVRPGVTGWAQVNGRNAVTWPEKLRMDVWYVEHVSPALDAGILLRTVGAVTSGRSNASSPGHATMSEFTGREQ